MKQAQEIFRSTWSFVRTPRGRRALAGAVLVLAVLAGWLSWRGYVARLGRGVPAYQEPQGLVADSVSKSAGIAIYLPAEVHFAAAEAGSHLSFEPKISGRWAAGASDRQLIFQPSDDLTVGSYYRVQLQAGDVHLAEDFSVAEDPKILAVFPGPGVEAPETSEITVAFSRPMVPLTALQENLAANVPVSVSPATPGRFRWASTRTLKFVPAERLKRSSTYTVSVGPGLVSVEGLLVAPTTTSFTTRPLRYETLHHAGNTLYREPFAIRFNQPVDLGETAKLISVVEAGNRKPVPIEAEYGTREALAGTTGKTATYRDKSVIFVYQQQDRNGRKHFWDSETSYELTVRGAVPLEGDIRLTEPRSLGFQVPGFIASAAAVSKRSELATPELFDPEGTLALTFYEDIDKDRSHLSARGLRGATYGTRCKVDGDGNDVRLGDGCEEETNYKQLILSFDPGALSPGQSAPVEIDRLVNRDGVTLNAGPVTQPVTVYPPLKVSRTFPGQNDAAASLTGLTVCTNSPLKDPEADQLGKYLNPSASIGRWFWHPAFRVSSPGTGIRCGVGEFQNDIGYGLQPETPYRLDFNFEDHFGQRLSYQLSFKSGKVQASSRSLTPLQKGYNVTTPSRTKLTYVSRNLEYVNVHICKTSATDMLGYLRRSIAPTTAGQELTCAGGWTKRVDLPKRYWSDSYLQVDLKELVGENAFGYYVVSVSHPELREQVYNQKTGTTEPGRPVYDRAFVNVTNLAAQSKQVQVEPESAEPERATERRLLAASGGDLYWVTYMGSLAPAGGATVVTYEDRDGKIVQTGSARTDASGVARVKPSPGETLAVVSLGQDSTLVSSQTDQFQWASSYSGGDKTYIYTDRSMYRPGQDVFLKGIYRIGFDGTYDVFRDKPVPVKIFSSKGDQVFTQDIAVGDRGTFDATFHLAPDAPLGTYRIEAKGGMYTFSVEEYVPSAFKLDVSSDKDEYVAGDDYALSLDANYYFGVPVEGGKVEYAVLAQDYYFDRYQDGSFQFGAPWYYNPEASYGDAFVSRGTVNLDAGGKARVSQKLDFDKLFKSDARSTSKIFVARMTVTNATGQSVSTEKSFIVHRGDYYLGVRLERNFFGAGEQNRLMLKSVDNAGKERAVRGLKVTVSKVTWNYFKRQEVDGGYYYHSERKLEKVKELDVSTDDRGNYGEPLTLDAEGEYELNVSGTDGRGNQVTAVQDVYVYGAGTVTVRPLNNESLDLAVERSKVEVGQRASVVVKSPFKKARALFAVERGRILKYEILDVNQSFFEYGFTVDDSYAPNVYLTVLLLSPDPAVKFGQVNFQVGTAEKRIDVQIRPGKNHYLPGETVSLDVDTKGSNGEGVSAEVSLAVADLSVLALSGNPKKDPVSFFYDGRPLGVTTASNIKNILTEAEIPAGTKGGGGGEPNDLAKKKRGLFKDTAYWKANVVTDARGHARVEFVLPDNLTTWQVEGVGVTRDTKLGVGYREFTAQKQLMVVPLYPRFSLPGDTFALGAKVFNQTGEAQSLKVKLESKTFTLLDGTERSVRLAAGETKTVYFKVKSPESLDRGSHSFTLSARGGGYDDTVEQSFPIRRNETYEAVATSNYTTEQTSSEYVWLPKGVTADRGGLQVKASATLLGPLPEAIDYFVSYPYGCTEQMVSKIAAVAAVKRLAKEPGFAGTFTVPAVTLGDVTYSADDVVSIGLSRILGNQNPDGGFAYYPRMQSDFYLTLQILNAFQDLRRAGVPVDQSAERRAVDYAYQRYVQNPNAFQDRDTLILAAYTFANSPAGAQQFANLKPRIDQLIKNKQFMNEQAGNAALVHLALLAVQKYPADVSGRVLATLEARVSIDARGASLKPSPNAWLWGYYETPAKDTALLVKAITAARRESVVTDKLIRWLMQSRAKDGSWGTTNSTVATLDALVVYLDWKRETDSRFSLSFSVDGATVTARDFGEGTVLGSLEAFLPVASFTPEHLTKLSFRKDNKNTLPNGYYSDMVLRYYLPIERIAPRDEGFTIERELYALGDRAGEHPLEKAKVGQVLRGHLKIVVTEPRNFAAIESFIPAGTELVNFNLATENQQLQSDAGAPAGPTTVVEPSGVLGGLGRWFRSLGTNPGGSGATGGDLPDWVYSPGADQTLKPLPIDAQELHDDRLMLFTGSLPPGVYQYDYFVRALVPGTFHELPAVASELYFPENFGRTRGGMFEVVP